MSARGELQWRSAGVAAAKPQPVAPAKRKVDPAIRLASGEGRAQFRSVIIDREQEVLQDSEIRSAQLPGIDDPVEEPAESLPADPMTDELPPLDTPQPDDLDMPPQPQDENTLDLESEQRQRYDNQPQQLPMDQGPIEGSPGQPAPLDTTMPPGALPDVIPTPSVGTMEAEREKSSEACDQGLEDLREKTIDTLSLSIAVSGDEGSDFPFECDFEEDRWHDGRCWDQTTYMWKASALCHKPLFFEDEHLERYGHSWSPMCQPLVSGAHFFTRLPVLPYCMGVEPPNECIYALGHYRPGNCAPYMCNPIPLSCRGAVFQAGAVVGAAAVLP